MGQYDALGSFVSLLDTARAYTCRQCSQLSPNDSSQKYIDRDRDRQLYLIYFFFVKCTTTLQLTLFASFSFFQFGKKKKRSSKETGGQQRPTIMRERYRRIAVKLQWCGEEKKKTCYFPSFPDRRFFLVEEVYVTSIYLLLVLILPLFFSSVGTDFFCRLKKREKKRPRLFVGGGGCSLCRLLPR